MNKDTISLKALNLLHGMVTASTMGDMRQILVVRELLYQYIAELETEIKNLKPYRDGNIPADNLPKEGENVIVTYSSGTAIAQFRNGRWFDSFFSNSEIRNIYRWWGLPGVE